eukprot:164663-Rhodomonas_salina.3
MGISATGACFHHPKRGIPATGADFPHPANVLGSSIRYQSRSAPCFFSGPEALSPLPRLGRAFAFP